jgi:hypothetical protein
MAINKKGQFFTLIAVMILILFIASYEVYSIHDDRSSVKKRISTMDSFLSSFEQDLAREMYIFGFRAVFVCQDYTAKTGEYISDTNEFFKEAFFNGTLNGNYSNVLMGATLPDILTSSNTKASLINVNIEMNNSQISVYQEDPWNLAVVFSFNLTMKDESGLASWEKQEKIKAIVPIEGFEDPIYIVNTGGKLAYRINRTIYEGSFVSGSDVTNLTKQIKRRYYSANPDAPSFLKRMQGDLSADPEGIESLVDIDALSQQGITIQEKNVADHIYFSLDNPSSSHVTGMPSWFTLDDPHLTKYGAMALKQ